MGKGDVFGVEVKQCGISVLLYGDVGYSLHARTQECRRSIAWRIYTCPRPCCDAVGIIASPQYQGPVP